ncbi:MAG: uracil-DNA glycosylase [Candidatus Babeliales bacterium]
MEQLYAPYKQCTACPLGTLGRTHVVFGEGNPDAKVVIIGEGPGQKEDELNKPFVGRSGQLLNRTLEHIGIQRSDIFITNVVKCRPPGNRAPTLQEATTCKNLLLFKQLKIIRPQFICTLGASALESLLDQKVKMTQMRGKFSSWNTIKLFPTFHPAYILRNPRELPTFIHDLKTLFEKAS